MYYPLQDRDNVQNAINPLSGRTTHCVQTKKYPKYIKSIQTLYPVHTSNSSITKYKSICPVDSSFKTQLAFCIASEYYVHLWPSVQCLYTTWKLPDSYRTNLNLTLVTRFTKEVILCQPWTVAPGKSSPCSCNSHCLIYLASHLGHQERERLSIWF